MGGHRVAADVFDGAAGEADWDVLRQGARWYGFLVVAESAIAVTAAVAALRVGLGGGSLPELVVMTLTLVVFAQSGSAHARCRARCLHAPQILAGTRGLGAQVVTSGRVGQYSGLSPVTLRGSGGDVHLQFLPQPEPLKVGARGTLYRLGKPGSPVAAFRSAGVTHWVI